MSSAWRRPLRILVSLLKSRNCLWQTRLHYRICILTTNARLDVASGWLRTNPLDTQRDISARNMFALAVGWVHVSDFETLLLTTRDGSTKLESRQKTRSFTHSSYRMTGRKVMMRTIPPLQKPHH